MTNCQDNLSDNLSCIIQNKKDILSKRDAVASDQVPKRETTMINEDTIYLLRECNAGTQMAVYSIGEILENVKDQKLREILISSKTITNSLATNCIFCCRNTAIRQRPGVIAKGMSWIKTNAKLAIDDSDRVCADLITDGCHMGTKTMQRHINQYLAADREARGKAEELIRMEELLACELKPFL